MSHSKVLFKLNIHVTSNKWVRNKSTKKKTYRKIPNITTLVTFEISTLLGLTTFRGVATFGEQQTLYKVGVAELFLRNRRKFL